MRNKLRKKKEKCEAGSPTGLAMSKMTQELKIALVIQLARAFSLTEIALVKNSTRAILPNVLGCSKTTSTLISLQIIGFIFSI